MKPESYLSLIMGSLPLSIAPLSSSADEPSAILVAPTVHGLAGGRGIFT